MHVALAHPSAGFVTGKVYRYNQPDAFQSVGKPSDPTSWLRAARLGRGERDVGQYEAVAERELVDDVYVLVRRAVYDEVGGYGVAGGCTSLAMPACGTTAA